MRGEIKKCPFCGSKAEIRDFYDVVNWTDDDEPITRRRFVCECKGVKCLVSPVTDAFDTEEEAIEAWNMRSEGAIKALGQESILDILDKIRAEIKDWQTDIHDNECDAENHDFVFERIYEIIDEYKEESEVNK